MLSLKQYIYESSGVKVSQEWMEKMFKEFNETLFNNVLPHCDLYAKKLKKSLLGLFYFQEKIVCRTTLIRSPFGKYRMYHKDTKEPITIENISIVRPAISMNINGIFKDETAMESTLIHEMIHFYTYMRGYAPSQAHGKEFKAMCASLKGLGKKKYGKEFDLSIYADCENFEMSDEQKQKEENKYAKQGLNLIIVEAPDTKFKVRLIVTSNKFVEKIIKEIKELHSYYKNIDNIRISIIEHLEQYSTIDYLATLRMSRIYRTFYLPENISELYNKVIDSGNIKLLFENGKEINESKFKSLLKKIKDKIANLFIKAETNLSISDIEKIGEVVPTEVEEC